MEEKKLHILVGIPASGKTTWVKRQILDLIKQGKNPLAVSRDVIRFAILDLWDERDDYFKYEADVFDNFIEGIQTALEIDKITDIFADATHISPKSRMKLLRRLRLNANIIVIFEVFDVDFEIAMKRNLKRKGRELVPINVMQSMWNGFKIPDEKEIRDIRNTLNLENEVDINLYRER